MEVLRLPAGREDGNVFMHVFALRWLILALSVNKFKDILVALFFAISSFGLENWIHTALYG